MFQLVVRQFMPDRCADGNGCAAAATTTIVGSGVGTGSATRGSATDTAPVVNWVASDPVKVKARNVRSCGVKKAPVAEGGSHGPSSRNKSSGRGAGGGASRMGGASGMSRMGMSGMMNMGMGMGMGTHMGAAEASLLRSELLYPLQLMRPFQFPTGGGGAPGIGGVGWVGWVGWAWVRLDWGRCSALVE